jgi:SM-20-related protein
MLNSDLDLARWRNELKARGRVQIDAILQPGSAERLYECLMHEVPWGLAHKAESTPGDIAPDALAALGEEGYAALLRRCYAHAENDYAFAYERYPMIRAYRDGRDPDLLLHRVLEFFNSPEYLGFARALTGNPAIRRVNAQATRYRAGHFLKRHDDYDVGEGRLYAYVLNLSQHWQPDWGGLLQFLDDGDALVDTLLPRWNTLSLFRVPAPHCVSLVAPWARQPRFAITGWFLL